MVITMMTMIINPDTLTVVWHSLPALSNLDLFHPARSLTPRAINVICISLHLFAPTLCLRLVLVRRRSPVHAFATLGGSHQPPSPRPGTPSTPIFALFRTFVPPTFSPSFFLAFRSLPPFLTALASKRLNRLLELEFVHHNYPTTR